MAVSQRESGDRHRTTAPAAGSRALHLFERQQGARPVTRFDVIDPKSI